jgi:N-ethylmaleimide reductase
MSDIDILFTPLALGDMRLRNRIAFAPCSRHRAYLDGTPTGMMVDYYRQRATAGLIVSEATAVSPMGNGYLFTPGLYTDKQAEEWRKVTTAVHEAGGLIVAQLYHAGRMTDALELPGGATPVAPSAVQPDPKARHYTVNCPRAKRAYQQPRALGRAEVRQVVAEFAAAAVRARQAGFDGVELHGASGYLVMQFLSTNTNLRDDEYGGSVAGRAKFLLDCVDAMQAATRPGFVAVKVGPGWTYHDVFDDDPVATYSYVAAELDRRRIAYFQVGNFGQDWDVVATLRRHFGGPVMGVGGYSRLTAAQAMASGRINVCAFGQAYMANPDLVERFRNAWPLNRPDAATFYTQGIEGYSDYPAYAEADRATLVPVDTVFAGSSSARAREAGNT